VENNRKIIFISEKKRIKNLNTSRNRKVKKSDFELSILINQRAIRVW